MSLFLKLTFLFCIGSLCGWCLEVFYRRFFSDANPERKWINPGLCQGPYLPLYGTGLCALYLLASTEQYNMITNPILNKVVLFTLMAISMTGIEFILGYLTLHYLHVRLWDYTHEWGNIEGLICPKFSMYWTILGAMYYFLIHPHILDSLNWLANNLGFSFGIGFFFGVFGIDFAHATNMIVTIKKYADEHDMVVKYEEFKEEIRKHHEAHHLKYHFFAPLRMSTLPVDYLNEMRERKERIESEFNKVKEDFQNDVSKAKENFHNDISKAKEELQDDLADKLDQFKTKED